VKGATSSPDRIPDLWAANEDAVRLYQFYISILQMNDRHERATAACRQIRRYAARGPGLAAGLFTISMEIEAWCAVGDYETAWRRLRLQEEIVYGKRIDLRRRRWRGADGFELQFSYAPLLYFRGRYRRGCQLLEKSLDFCFDGTKMRSFDILNRVYNGELEPTLRARVTLAHFYGRLGENLRQWRHWTAFVDGFHPRLFRLSGVSRKELQADSRQLAPFFEKLMEEQGRRITSGIGGSQSDLIESSAKVRKRQADTNRKLNAFKKRIGPVRKEIDRKLQQYFPELREFRW
jgi:hypothetical protein